MEEGAGEHGFYGMISIAILPGAKLEALQINRYRRPIIKQ